MMDIQLKSSSNHLGKAVKRDKEKWSRTGYCFQCRTKKNVHVIADLTNALC